MQADQQTLARPDALGGGDAARPPQPAGRFRADIEGLRAVAILLVVLFHAGVPAFAGGYIGVDVFFVLSGYLITSIVQRELTTTGGLSFLGFYARRARRLMPASALVLLVTLAGVVIVCSPLEVRTYARSASAVSLYVSNLLFASRSTDYLGVANEVDPFLQTWSLAVEEQFYFVWPVLLLGLFLVGRRLRSARATLIGMGLLAAGSFVACVVTTQVRQPWAFFLTPFRFWEFAAGGIAGLLSWTWLTRSRAVPWIGGAGLLAIVGAALVLDQSTTFPGAVAAVPVVATLAVLVAGTGDAATRPTTLLGLAPLQWIGRHSYSWYLWHWPLLVLVLVRHPHASTTVRLGVMAVALGLSAVTFVVVERPARESAWLRARPGASVAGGLALAGLCLVASVAVGRHASAALATPEQRRITAAAADQPMIYDDGCLVPFLSTDPIDPTDGSCTYGDPDGDRTLVLFGDSHAAHLAPALDVAGKEHGWKVQVHLKASCASLDLPTYAIDRLGRPYTECDEWRDRVMTTIEDDRPDAVVLSNLVDYVDGDTSAWADALEGTTGRLSAAGIPALQVTDVPAPGTNVPFCLSRAASATVLGADDCSFDRAGAPSSGFAAVDRKAVAGTELGRATDLDEAVCPVRRCEVDRDGVIVFSDANHLTASFSATLADELATTIRPMVDRTR